MVRLLRNTYLNRVLVLTSALVALAVAGCAGRVVNRAVENKIEDRLPELFGPAASYDVEVDGSALKVMRGRLSRVVIHGQDVWMLPELCVDGIDVEMREVVVDLDTQGIKSVRSAIFDAVVSEKALNDYFERTRSDEMRVELQDGRMVVRARPKVLGLALNVRLMGVLVPRGEELDFRIDRLQVIGISAPHIAAGMIEDRINPVLDLRSMDFEPELRSVTIKAGSIRLVGAARVTGEGLARAAALGYRK